MGRKRVYCGRGGSKGLSTYAKIAGNPIDQEKKNRIHSHLEASVLRQSLSKIYISPSHLEALKVCILRESYRSLPEIYKSGCWEEK